MYKQNYNHKNKKKEIEYSNSFLATSNIELLDFLLLNLKGQSRNNIKTILKNKCVIISGKPITQYDYLLKPGTLVQISKSPIKNVTINNKTEVKLKILYEDDDFIAIDKPSGLLSISTDKEKEKTAYHYVLSYCKANNKNSKIFVLHRLDRDTSGVLVFCKNIDLRNMLQDKWNEIVSEREYFAVCRGIFSKKSGRLVNYLKESKTHFVYISENVNDQKAITNYEVIEEKSNSLIKINLETGRKNQIRVQMANINHPVLGDEKYGDGKNKRLYLHSSSLSFIHPLNNKLYNFKSSLPSEFKFKI